MSQMPSMADCPICQKFADKFGPCGFHARHADPPMPTRENKLALHYTLTAQADIALAAWHEERGNRDMAEFFRTQAALHTDMAEQAALEEA